jgi:hypothetical protein
MGTQWLIHQKSIDGNKLVGKITFTHPTNPVISLFNDKLVIQMKKLNNITKISLLLNEQIEFLTTIDLSKKLNKIKWLPNTDSNKALIVLKKNNQLIIKQNDVKIASLNKLSNAILMIEIDDKTSTNAATLLGCILVNIKYI